MIKHIVAWKIKAAKGRSKDENICLLKERLEALQDLIPEIINLAVHTNSPLAKPDNYDIVIESEFESMKALNTYSDHPDHIELKELLADIRTEKAAVDYEI